jgi:hypothetical protein
MGLTFAVAKSYGVSDRKLFDYCMEELHGEWFRGPLDRGPDAVAWLGAAQTFGRLVAEPFPSIVGKRLGLGTLNLGSGGTGPQYYLHHPQLLDEVNRCRVAVVQIMSARGSDNSLFRSSEGGRKGVRVDTGALTKSLPEELLDEGRDREANRVLRESQAAYVEAMRSLLDAIEPPTISLWISSREPVFANCADLEASKRGSPQLITAEMVSAVVPLTDRFVAVVSQAGIPNEIRDLEGSVARTNRYYPSPEMHRLAADELAPVVRDLISD